MEERGDFQGNVIRPSSLRPSGSLKSTLSGKSTPRGSPSFRRLYSSRTPRREGRGTTGGHFQWIWSNRLLLWLILITLWAYLGFYVQSKWAHGDNNGKEQFVGYRSKEITGISHMVVNNDSVTTEDVMAVNITSTENQVVESKIQLNMKNNIGTVTKKKKKGGARSISSRKTRRSSAARKLRSKTRGKEKVVKDDDISNDLMEQEEEIPKRNTSYGLLVGPFGATEDRTLEWSAEKRSGTCDRKGEFSRMVWSRKFVLVFHELSMTGAPLSMMELATEFLSCGATVSAVVLSKRGGLMGELVRRKIKVIEDKADLSYKTAMKADLVIAGSAICSTWIEQYVAHFPAGSGQIAWWIMENRREYFERAKPMLNRVKLLVFLSESQSKQWLTWCEEDGIKLNSAPALLPLSVNDELAFVAGIPCSLNTPSFSVENMMERRRLLRDAVRKEMGLTDKDMLVMSLSSINPGKGQLLLLESALLTIDQDLAVEGSGINGSVKEGNISSITVSEERSAKDGNQHSRALFENMQIGESLNETKRKFPISSSYGTVTARSTHKMRNLLSENDEKAKQNQTLKVLIGSVGSKSNKVPYVKGILRFLSQHPELSKLVLWTPATTRVASLYSAADAYVINSQGLGETFGRVTIEAMAFGLPVLGTDAGGTKEIVEHNVTGLLHPLGRPGNQVLAQNLLFMLNNPSEREQMGMRGRRKVEQMYLKHDMYEKFAFILFKCMRIK